MDRDLDGHVARAVFIIWVGLAHGAIPLPLFHYIHDFRAKDLIEAWEYLLIFIFSHDFYSARTVESLYAPRTRNRYFA